MASYKCFEELPIWQESRLLSKVIYELLDKERFRRDFHLRNQMSRSCGSIQDNIAEGFDRGTTRTFIYFLSISRGSCSELKSQLYRALDRSHITADEFEAAYLQATKISKMVTGFITYLRIYKSEGNTSK